MTGTFKGEYGGVLPNNKQIKIWGIVIERIANSKVVEVWESVDQLGMMQQMGAIPVKK